MGDKQKSTKIETVGKKKEFQYKKNLAKNLGMKDCETFTSMKIIWECVGM